MGSRSTASNNTTTARDLATLLLAIEDRRAVSAASTREILAMLLAQEFNDGIPAGLPPGTRVAHKTGEITATWHDAALIYPPDGRPYALVVLTRGIPERGRGIGLHADVAQNYFALRALDVIFLAVDPRPYRGVLVMNDRFAQVGRFQMGVAPQQHRVRWKAGPFVALRQGFAPFG